MSVYCVLCKVRLRCYIFDAKFGFTLSSNVNQKIELVGKLIRDPIGLTSSHKVYFYNWPYGLPSLIDLLLVFFSSGSHMQSVCQKADPGLEIVPLGLVVNLLFPLLGLCVVQW